MNWKADAVRKMREQLKAEGKSEKEINAIVVEKSKAAKEGKEPDSPLATFHPEQYRKLVDPYDPMQDIQARARSYLHSNCSQCHVEAGGGNAQMQLEFTTPLDKMKIFDEKPQHDTFGLQDARLIAPGYPERSVLWHRLSHRGRGQMPPLATSIVDQPAVDLIRDWIRQMK
jgi:mono/diheme cytochrome c family protein